MKQDFWKTIRSQSPTELTLSLGTYVWVIESGPHRLQSLLKICQGSSILFEPFAIVPCFSVKLSNDSALLTLGLSLQSSGSTQLPEQVSSAIKVPESFQLDSNYQSESHISPLHSGSQPPGLCQCLVFTNHYLGSLIAALVFSCDLRLRLFLVPLGGLRGR